MNDHNNHHPCDRAPIRQAIIMRGISASGKSTWVAGLQAIADQQGRVMALHSTDHYFLDALGQYRFEARRLAEAHLANQHAFQTSLARQIPYVICDNTNLTPQEFNVYAQAAHQADYQVILCQLPCRSLIEHQQLQAQGHALPEVVVLRQWQRFHRYHPLRLRNAFRYDALYEVTLSDPRYSSIFDDEL